MRLAIVLALTKMPCTQHTLFCTSLSAPTSSIRRTQSVRPLAAASASAVFPLWNFRANSPHQRSPEMHRLKVKNGSEHNMDSKQQQHITTRVDEVRNYVRHSWHPFRPRSAKADARTQFAQHERRHEAPSTLSVVSARARNPRRHDMHCS